jgi:hypothetical protein
MGRGQKREGRGRVHPLPKEEKREVGTYGSYYMALVNSDYLRPSELAHAAFNIRLNQARYIVAYTYTPSVEGRI